MRLDLALTVSLLLGWLPNLVQAASVRDCLSSLTFDQGGTDHSTLKQGVLHPVFSYNGADCASGYYLSFNLVGEPGRPTVRCAASSPFVSGRGTRKVTLNCDNSRNVIPSGLYYFDFELAASRLSLLNKASRETISYQIGPDESDPEACAKSFQIPQLGASLLKTLLSKLNLATSWNPQYCRSDFTVVLKIVDQVTQDSYVCSQVALDPLGAGQVACLGLPILGLIPQRRYNVVGILADALGVQYALNTVSTLADTLAPSVTLPIVSSIVALPSATLIEVSGGAVACANSLNWTDMEMSLKSNPILAFIPSFLQGRSQLATTFTYGQGCDGYSIITTLNWPTGSSKDCTQIKANPGGGRQLVTCGSNNRYAMGKGYYFSALVTNQATGRRSVHLARRDTAEVDSPEFEVTYAATSSDPARKKRAVEAIETAKPLNSKFCKNGYTACPLLSGKKGFEVRGKPFTVPSHDSSS